MSMTAKNYSQQKTTGLIQANDPILGIALCMLVAILLTLYPLPPVVNAWRADWFFMLVYFWGITRADWFGVGLAFCIGILADLCTDAMLGQHALVFICLTTCWRFIFYTKGVTLNVLTHSALLPLWMLLYLVLLASIDYFTQQTVHLVTWKTLLITTLASPIWYLFWLRFAKLEKNK